MAANEKAVGRSREPLYARIAAVMRQRIEVGHWARGEKISTLEQLEEEFGAARITVRQAIELLRDEGLLRTQQGRGTFVLDRPKRNRSYNLGSDFQSLVEATRSNVVRRVHIEETSDIPALWPGEGKPAAAYAFLSSVQVNQSEPFSVVNVYLEKGFFDRNAETLKHSAALPRVAEQEEIVSALQSINVGVADSRTADLLNIGLGEPTADARIVLINADGIAVYVADVHYHKDYFSMKMDLLNPGRKPVETPS